MVRWSKALHLMFEWQGALADVLALCAAISDHAICHQLMHACHAAVREAGQRQSAKYSAHRLARWGTDHLAAVPGLKASIDAEGPPWVCSIEKLLQD